MDNFGELRVLHYGVIRPRGENLEEFYRHPAMVAERLIDPIGIARYTRRAAEKQTTFTGR